MGLFKEKTPSYEDETTKAFTNKLEMLQKRSRNVESRCTALNNFTPSVSRMMHSQIEKLKSSNNKMQKQLSADCSSLAWLTEQKACQEVDTNETEDTQEEWLTAITHDKQERVNRLERLAEEFQYGIMERRKAEGGIYATKEAREHDVRQAQLLEHRLHRARIDFNRRVTSNRGMRQMIHNLRVDRVMVERMISHILKQINKIADDIGDVVNKSMILADGRDHSIDVVVELKRGGDQEHRQFQEQWRELGRLVSYNDRLKGFIANLGDRKLVKEKEKWAQGQEVELRKIMTAGAWDIAKDKACIKITKARVDMFKGHFDKLQRATGVEGMPELLALFENSEDNNFRQFQIVNVLSNDIEDLEHSVLRLHDETTFIEDAQKCGDSGLAADGQSKETLVSQKMVARVRANLESAHREIAILDDKTEDHARTVVNMRAGIGKILQLFGNVDHALWAMPITEASLVDHLSLMEDLVCQLLSDYMTQQNSFSNDVYVRNNYDATAVDEDLFIADTAVALVPPSLHSDRDDQFGNNSDDSSASEQGNAPFLTGVMPKLSTRRRNRESTRS